MRKEGSRSLAPRKDLQQELKSTGRQRDFHNEDGKAKLHSLPKPCVGVAAETFIYTVTGRLRPSMPSGMEEWLQQIAEAGELSRFKCTQGQLAIDILERPTELQTY